MPKSKSASGSSYSYFKQLFGEHPEWLNEKSNSAITARYRADHGLGEDDVVEKKVLSNLANLKSLMRKLRREQETPSNGAPSFRSGNRLEALEERIDDCLTLARSLDRAALEEVILLLRRARNKVVWQLGEKG